MYTYIPHVPELGENTATADYARAFSTILRLFRGVFATAGPKHYDYRRLKG
jgi:hypothetical protein